VHHIHTSDELIKVALGTWKDLTKAQNMEERPHPKKLPTSQSNFLTIYLKFRKKHLLVSRPIPTAMTACEPFTDAEYSWPMQRGEES
jgi:hypothetical protein